VTLDTLERAHLARPVFRAYERYHAVRAGRLPDVGTDGLPLPPNHLQALVTPIPSLSFEPGGELAANSIRELVAEGGQDLAEFGAVLDFGVGCGRVARHWAKIPGPEWHGSDYNAALSGWCHANLPHLITVRNTASGPLPYADERFDLVYAISVFTHLDEAAQATWMRELRRVIRPGGLIFFTTHGEAMLVQAPEQEIHEAFARGEPAVRYPRESGSNLCSTFHPPRYVHEVLAGALEPVAERLGGMPGLDRQDAYLFRR
jgi:SAM-dependent methyltransferase